MSQGAQWCGRQTKAVRLWWTGAVWWQAMAGEGTSPALQLSDVGECADGQTRKVLSTQS